MSNKGCKRKYRNSLDFVEDGLRACWQNASDLLQSSKILLDSGHHAPALSLSVLALEELGKLLALNGLLFASPNGPKAKTAAKSGRDHTLKLSAIPWLDMLVRSIALLADPRLVSDAAFQNGLDVSSKSFKTDFDTLLNQLPGKDIQDLDRLKQQGFYLEERQGRFCLPQDNIEPSLAATVHRLAARAVTLIDSVIKDGNLERYIDAAKSLRRRMTEADHLHFEQSASDLVHELFDLDSEPN